MAISLVGSPTEASATNGNNVVLSLPAGMQQNDVVYVFSGVGQNASITTSSPGWTTLFDNSIGGLSIRCALFRKVMGATPDTSITIVGTGASADAQCAIAYALRVVDTTTPEDTTLGQASGTSTDPDPASITTVTDGAWVIVFACSKIFDSTVTAPTGYSNQVDIAANDTRAHTVAGATKLKATAGVEAPAAWTGWSSANWNALTLAVRPGVSFISASATQSLSIGQSATATVIVKATATQPLAIAQTATVKVVAQATAAQSLSIAQTATAKAPASLTATQSLAIAQTATAITPISLTATQPLSLAQAATAVVLVKATATQPLSIAQTATVAVLVKAAAAQSLSISQAAVASTTFGTIEATATQSLSIAQTATATVLVKAQAAQSLSIAQSATAVAPASATAAQSLSIAQSATAKTIISATAAQSLGLVQSATAEAIVSATATQPLSIAQSATATVLVKGAVAQSFIISQTALGSTGGVILATADQSLSIGQTAEAQTEIVVAPPRFPSQGGKQPALLIRRRKVPKRKPREKIEPPVPRQVIHLRARQSLSIQQEAFVEVSWVDLDEEDLEAILAMVA